MNKIAIAVLVIGCLSGLAFAAVPLVPSTESSTTLQGVGWEPPSGSPAAITKDDYLKAMAPFEAEYERIYPLKSQKPFPYAFEAVPVFASYWRATHDPRYAEFVFNAIDGYGRAVKEQIAKEGAMMKRTGTTRPTGSEYYTWDYAYLVVSVLEMKDAPGYEHMARRLGEILSSRATAWPIYWEVGAQNRAIFPAFWYDAALMFAGSEHLPKGAITYADTVWSAWWIPRDVEEDCAHYSALDLLVLDAWSRVRGVQWWNDKRARRLWSEYAEQISNDGTWPAYGDGGVYGDYFVALRIAETAAARLHDGKFKWLAHRAFWNGKDRLASLVKGAGRTAVADLAMAYLSANDAVKEVAPTPGLAITNRRFRERTDWAHQKESASLFILHGNDAPSKLIFRGGSAEADQYILVQAGSTAGHGHPDTGSILFYGGDFAYFLSHGVSRLDHAMEQHNAFVLEDPDTNAPWKQGELTSEATSIPTHGSVPGASYARLEVSEFPGSKTTEADWEEVKGWDGKGYPRRRAIGYRNWPVRLERSILFIENRFVVVRDVVHFLIPAKARMGQNWLVGQFDSNHGDNWLNIRTPSVYAYPYSDPPRGLLDLARKDLLIWFAPDRESSMDVVQGPNHSSYNRNYINLPNRVWYPKRVNGRQATEATFTTVLFPHDPTRPAHDIAAGIAAVDAGLGATALKVKSGDENFLIVLNSTRRRVASSGLETDAEAAVVRFVDGRVSASTWGAKTVAWHGQSFTIGLGPTQTLICGGQSVVSCRPD